MLSSLSLNNVALIKKQTIEFGKGFNCLLGQSGAGKSIIISALNFSLGAKADKNLVRSGENQLRVDAVFDDLSQEAIDYLKDQEIDIENEIIITRSITSEGKSSIKVNGFPVTVKCLQGLSELLADFCGQHDSIGLLNVNNHIFLLDRFIGKEIEQIKLELSEKIDQLKECESKIKKLGGSEIERARTKELLNYQVQEIESANLVAGEMETLKERFDFISSAENILDKVGESVSKLEEQRESVTTLLYDAKSALSGLSNFKDIEECHSRIENCYYEVKDIVETLMTIKNSTEFDPIELERIDSRLDLIKKLSKKYGKTVEDILVYLAKCKKELEELEDSEFMLNKLQNEKSTLEKQVDQICQDLSTIRKNYASKLEVQIMKQLEDLEMKGTYFKVDFEQIDFSKKGFDGIKFMFSANKGQEAKDLNKTASGGELSRLMLAFKNVLLDKEKVQTVVFDEIDSGISGHTAGKLAEKIANISRYVQVICITHTPVVASKANTFLLVEKHVIDETTVSEVKKLDEDEAVTEVARLIDGGKEVSNTAIEHAKKLFE